MKFKIILTFAFFLFVNFKPSFLHFIDNIFKNLKKFGKILITYKKQKLSSIKTLLLDILEILDQCVFARTEETSKLGW